LAAADPRLATRTGETAPAAVLERIGTEGVLAEDVTARIRGGSLDLFAFRERARALDEAAKLVAASEELPEHGLPDGSIARPRLERELLARLIDEERVRTADEALLGPSSGDLVRGIVSTWTPPATPQDWPDRDAWVSTHLLEIRASLTDGRPLVGPFDLDLALYPLERLLAPLQFPRGSAAIARVRVAMDADMRAVPPIVAAERLASEVKVHLGVTLDSTLRTQLEGAEASLRDLATTALERAGGGNSRRAVEARARDLLLAEGPCPPVAATRVRSMSPPPERAGICGALHALAEEATSSAEIVALHDDVLIAIAAISTSPPPRTGLMSHPEDDAVDSLRRTARERPVFALGIALCANLLYGRPGGEERLRAWRALGEAPLDVVAREVSLGGEGAKPPAR
jgi:hypothetical protein